jgi:DNA ligase-1
MFKPMLACEVDLDKLRFPVLASAKLDGVRAIVRDGVVYSRSNKPIPNKFVQQRFKHLEHFDGELIYGAPTATDVYRRTVSAVMSQSTDGEDVAFHVFDHVGWPHEAYALRQGRTLRTIHLTRGVFSHLQVVIDDLNQLLTFETECLGSGYEGLILRDPNAPYKMGRSTMKEQYLMKLKRFTDAEFEVIGYEERMENTNEAFTNELGRTKRSSHQAGKVGRGDLGALVLQGDGFTFSCGTGFDDATRQALWEARDRDLIGRLAKIKFFQIGMKEAPRHPVFISFRPDIDL